MKAIKAITMLVCAICWSGHICPGQPLPENRYVYADSVASAYYGFPLDNLRQLADSLTSHAETDLEKFRILYTWICTNISADYGLYTIQLEKHEQFRDDPVRLGQWQHEFSRQMFDKLLKERTTLCSGYTYLVRQLAVHAGIECVIIEGYGRTRTSDKRTLRLPNHSWNAVKIDNQWFMCDPTWSAGRISGRSGDFVFDFNDKYFLVDPADFILDHYPLDSYWSLLDEPPTLEQFFERQIFR